MVDFCFEVLMEGILCNGGSGHLGEYFLEENQQRLLV